MIEFYANPHALITKNIVTDVVYMQNYSQEEIEETLKKYTYEEVVRLEDYGNYIEVDYIKIDQDFYPPKPFASWVPSKVGINTGWKAPVEPPKNLILSKGEFFVWNEEALNWEVEVNCCPTCDK